eukprot:scaffold84580_cov69-Phaeocystis_antarctica.AAC.3
MKRSSTGWTACTSTLTPSEGAGSPRPAPNATLVGAAAVDAQAEVIDPQPVLTLTLLPARAAHPLAALPLAGDAHRGCWEGVAVGGREDVTAAGKEEVGQAARLERQRAEGGALVHAEQHRRRTVGHEGAHQAAAVARHLEVSARGGERHGPARRLEVLRAEVVRLALHVLLGPHAIDQHDARHLPKPEQRSSTTRGGAPSGSASTCAHARASTGAASSSSLSRRRPRRMRAHRALRAQKRTRQPAAIEQQASSSAPCCACASL